MHPTRSLAVLAALLPCLPLSAQDAEARPLQLAFGDANVLHEPPDGAEAQQTVWVAYPDGRGTWLDHRQYLEDLAVRWRDKGVAVGIVLPAAHAKAVASAAPKITVAAFVDEQPAELGVGPSSMTCLMGAGGRTTYLGNIDGIVDVVTHVLENGTADPYANFEVQLMSLLNNVADGGQFAKQVEQCLKAFPHSGRAHAAKVLLHWWCEGDLDAAREAIDAGINALANDAVPMAIFADLVLRGDRNDPRNARKLVMAMAPVAAGAPDGVFTQLVYLRALLLAGQDRLAGRIVAKLQKKVQGDTFHQLVFAETLMEAETPAAFRDLAVRSIDAAKADGVYLKWSYAARHKVLARCGEQQAADKLAAEYRKSDAGNNGLNNDAWYLIVQPPTMGRFDTLAGAQAEEMLRVEGDGIDYGNKDTVALAMFVNGKIERAVELQDEATKAGGNQPEYVGRLTRFRNTLEELRARAEKDGKKK